MGYEKTVVVLPAYEPVHRLVLLARTLSQDGFKVIVVNDGSSQEFAPIFKECEGFATILQYPKNLGKGHALRLGFQYIVDNLKDYEYVVTADCDGQHTIRDIKRMSDEIALRKCTIIGDRVFDVHVPLRSVVGNTFSKFGQSLFTYRYLHDNQCGLRAFLVNELPKFIKIKGERYEYEMNVITYILLKEQDYRMLKVDAIYENGNKTTHFRNVADTVRIHGSLLWTGLIRWISLAVALVLSWVFFAFVYPNDPSFPTYELSAITSFGISLGLNILLNLIILRPKHFFKMILRTVIYELLTFLTVLISVIVFGEILHVHITLAYFIGFVLSIFPLFMLIKGVGMLIDVQER